MQLHHGIAGQVHHGDGGLDILGEHQDFLRTLKAEPGNVHLQDFTGLGKELSNLAVAFIKFLSHAHVL